MQCVSKEEIVEKGGEVLREWSFSSLRVFRPVNLGETLLPQINKGVDQFGQSLL